MMKQFSTASMRGYQNTKRMDGHNPRPTCLTGLYPKRARETTPDFWSGLSAKG